MESLTQAFLSVEFGVTAVAILAIATAIKRTVKIKFVSFPKSAAGKAIMSWLNLALGAAAAYPTYLAGDTYFDRLMLGIVAGFVSVFVYNGIIKNVFPAQKTNADGTPPAVTK